MANRIYIPIINPLRFADVAKVNLPQYFTKQFDDFLFKDQILDVEQYVDAPQIWGSNDIITFQYSANYSPIQISIVGACDGTIWQTFTVSSSLRNSYEPDYYLYENNIDISALPYGRYYIQMEAGNPVQKTLHSEEFQILPNIKNTVFLEYQNSSYYEDIVFETGVKLALRIPGFIMYDEPGSQDVVYDDQDLNNTVLSSQHYRTYKLFVGRSIGVPYWQIDIIDRIIGCDNFTADGKPFSKPSGAKWEKNEEQYFPLRGWTIQLREAINRKSRIYDSEDNTAKKLMVVHNIQSKGFGDVFAPGQNVVPIIDLE